MARRAAAVHAATTCLGSGLKTTGIRVRLRRGVNPHAKAVETAVSA